MTDLLRFLASNLWWPFLALAACFGIGVGIGRLLTTRRPR